MSMDSTVPALPGFPACSVKPTLMNARQIHVNIRAPVTTARMHSAVRARPDTAELVVRQTSTNADHPLVQMEELAPIS